MSQTGRRADGPRGGDGGAQSGAPLLGPGPEFDRIRGIARVLGSRANRLDSDCAFIAAGDGFIAVSCDLSVEGVHFRRDWLTLEEIGWRAAASALSDLAAAGAEAIGLLTAVAVPDGAGPADLEQLMAGVGAAVDAAGGKVLGGDLSRGPAWTIDVTVLGRATRALTRRGARPGDALWVTGALGQARAALAAWRAGRTPEGSVGARFSRPEPRLVAGRWLERHGALAMLDLSDGLAGDAWHLAAASGVGIEIDIAAVPMGPGVEAAAVTERIDARVFAALGGEDYELLVALPPAFGAHQAAEFQQGCGLPVTRIGSVIAGSGVCFIHQDRRLELSGFDHFR